MIIEKILTNAKVFWDSTEGYGIYPAYQDIDI